MAEFEQPFICLFRSTGQRVFNASRRVGHGCLKKALQERLHFWAGHGRVNITICLVNKSDMEVEQRGGFSILGGFSAVIAATKRNKGLKLC